MRRCYEYSLIAALICVAVVTAVAVTYKPRETAPVLDDTASPVSENIEAIGPAALCENAAQLRSERSAEGITVYWCEA
jgi:hypothetical protein